METEDSGVELCSSETSFLASAAKDDDALKSLSITLGKLAFRGIRRSHSLAGKALWIGVTSRTPKGTPLGLIVHKSHELLFGEIDESKEAQSDPRVLERSRDYIDSLEPHGRIWKSNSAGLRHFSEDALDILCNIEPDGETSEQIEKDVPRTFPSLPYFEQADVSESLKKVLTAVANQLPEIGYVQGMNIIVGYLLLHVKTDAAAFELFMDMMLHPRYNLQAFFCDGLPGLIQFTKILQKVTEEIDPELFSHLDNIGMSSLVFTYQWTLTLFAYSMPFDEVAKLWDLFFSEGWTAILKATMVLMLNERTSLLNADFEDAYNTLKCSPTQPPSDFIEKLKNFPLSIDHADMVAELIRSYQF